MILDNIISFWEDKAYLLFGNIFFNTVQPIISLPLGNGIEKHNMFFPDSKNILTYMPTAVFPNCRKQKEQTYKFYEDH